MKKYITYIILTTLSALMIGGCVTRKFTPPQPSMPDVYTYIGDMDTMNKIINKQWWTMFTDTILNHLIDTALKKNKDLAIAASRIEQARLNIKVAKSEFLPRLELNASAGEMYFNSNLNSEYSIRPALGWEISLFGKMNSMNAAQKAALLSTEYAYKGVELSLISEVANVYFLLQGYRQSLDISIISYAMRRQSAAMVDSMFVHGISTGLDLEQARSLEATAAASIPQYQRAVAQASLALDVLLGANPNPVVAFIRERNIDKLADSPKYADLITKFASDINKLHLVLMTDSMPVVVPIGLPSSLLERRPDVMESYQNAVQAAAMAGVAEAARYPSINLTAEGGVFSSSVSGLITGNPFVWSAALGLTQPIFAFGRNKRNAQIAQEDAKQAVLLYEKSIITAMSDVEQSLIAVNTYKDQVVRLRELLRANVAAKIMTEALYNNGLVDYLQVLDANRTLFATQLQYISALSNQFSSYVNLYKALGGGW